MYMFIYRGYCIVQHTSLHASRFEKWLECISVQTKWIHSDLLWPSVAGTWWFHCCHHTRWTTLLCFWECAGFPWVFTGRKSCYIGSFEQLSFLIFGDLTTSGNPSNGDWGKCLTLIRVTVRECVYATRTAADTKIKHERRNCCYLISLLQTPFFEGRILPCTTTFNKVVTDAKICWNFEHRHLKQRCM